MSNMKKHVGVLKNTGVRCIVVFREIPEDTAHCLIIETDKLSDMYHENFLNIVNSPEAQQTNNFYEVLNRRVLSDGLNALQALHSKNLLRRVPVDMVTLRPFPNKDLPLAFLNSQISGNPVVNTSTLDSKLVVSQEESDLKKADLLLLEAEMLESEAKIKRDQAKAIYKEHNKVTTVVEKKQDRPGRPELSPEEKILSDAKRKERRRERDREKAAQVKEQKIKENVNKSVKEKIERDIERQS